MERGSKVDWINRIVIAAMIFAGLMAIQYYYNMGMRECISNPLPYAARAYEKIYGYPFIGMGYFVMEGGDSQIIFFDSNGTTLTERGAYNSSDEVYTI